MWTYWGASSSQSGRTLQYSAAEQVSIAIGPFFYGTSLFALSKINVGIRLIAVGCTLRLLVAKVVINIVSAEVATML